MRKFVSLGLCALMASAFFSGAVAGSSLDRGEDSERVQSQRALPAPPGFVRVQQEGASDEERAPAQQRGVTEADQSRHQAQGTPLESKPVGAIHADDLIGSPLMSREGNNVGPINDFIIDQDGQVLAVLVAAGGLLGLGEHDVAIAWDTLERSVDEDDDHVFHVDMIDQELRDAPRYKKE